MTIDDSGFAYSFVIPGAYEPPFGLLVIRIY